MDAAAHPFPIKRRSYFFLIERMTIRNWLADDVDFICGYCFAAGTGCRRGRGERR